MLLAEPEQPASLVNVVLPLIPWLVIFGFIWFFVYRGLRGERRKAVENAERARKHWDAVEAKLDKLIELWEQRKSGE